LLIHSSTLSAPVIFPGIRSDSQGLETYMPDACCFSPVKMDWGLPSLKSEALALQHAPAAYEKPLKPATDPTR